MAGIRESTFSMDGPSNRKFPILQEEKSYSPTGKDISYNPGMAEGDFAARLVADALKRKRISAKELSLKVGMTHSYLSEYTRSKRSPIWLPDYSKKGDPVRSVIAAELDIDERLLLPTRDPNPSVDDTRQTILAYDSSARTGKARATAPNPAKIDGMIPLYGHPTGGRFGQFPLKGNKIKEIQAPEALSGVDGAYALYVVGDYMEPTYSAGSVVYVHPRLPVDREKAIVHVVALIDGEDGGPADAYVKRFVSQDKEHLELLQYKPRRKLNFRSDLVQEIHKIIMGGDG